MSSPFPHLSRRQFLGGATGLATLSLLGLTGCGRAPSWTDIEGAWLDQDRDQHLELSPGNLAVEIARGPASVMAWTVTLEKGRLVLKPFSSPWPESRQKVGKPLVWDVDRSGSALSLQTDSRAWNLRKKADLTRPRQELTGLWRQVRGDQKVDYFQFTPWSTVIGVTWQPTHPEDEKDPGALLRVAEWWSYSSSEQGALELDGVCRDSDLAKTKAVFSIESSTLTYKLGGQTFTLRKTDKVEN